MATDENVVSLSWQGMPYLCRVVTPDRAHTTEPVLVLGGAMQDIHGWLRLERRLTAHTTVIIPQLPNPEDAPEPAACDFHTFVGAIHHALDRLGVARVNLLAVSYGAPIAFRLACDHPDRVARLLLAGATPRLGATLTALIRDLVAPRETAGDDAADRAADEERARRIVDVLMNTGRSDRIPMARAVHRMLHRYFTEHDTAARRYVAYHRVLLDQELYPPGGLHGVPALVFTGEHDNVSPPDQNYAVAATIADSTFLTIKDTDHMAHLEREAEYADLVVRFIHDRSLDGLDYCTPPTVPARAAAGA